MRSFRNPRYAPEALERKLHPSGISPVLVAADVYVPTTSAADPSASGSTDTGSYAQDSGAPSPTPATPPAGGTDPAPPPGNGDPPVDTPGTPVGPGEPG